MLRAVVTRLGELGHAVVATSPGRALDRLAQIEPRLAVLDLEACTRSNLVNALHARKLPIVVLGGGARLRTVMAARTLGARQVVDASFSVEELATALSATILAEPSPLSLLAVPRTTTLGDLLATLEQELRAGLARFARIPSRGDVRFTLRDPELVATYVRRLRAAVSRVVADVATAPCELTGAVIAVSGEAPRDPAADGPLAGARLVIVDQRVSRVDAVCGALRRAGAAVFACAPEELLSEMARIAELDPTAIVVEEDLGGTVERLLAEIAKDSRLHHSRLVAAPLGELWNAGERMLDTERLVELVLPSHREELTVAERLLTGSRFGVDLASLGPGRLLHAVAMARVPARVTHIEASCLLRVELAADGVVAGASARLPDRSRLEGLAALAVFLRRGKGMVDVEQLLDPSLVSILSPVATAIGLASGEPIPVVNSSVPPGPVTRVAWSNLPAPLAGRITWTSIPALSAEELSAYAIKDPSELLDAVEDDEEEEEQDRPTLAVDPSRVPGASLRMAPPPAIDVHAAEAAPPAGANVGPPPVVAPAAPVGAGPAPAAPLLGPLADALEPVQPQVEEPTLPLPETAEGSAAAPAAAGEGAGRDAARDRKRKRRASEAQAPAGDRALGEDGDAVAVQRAARPRRAEPPVERRGAPRVGAPERRRPAGERAAAPSPSSGERPAPGSGISPEFVAIALVVALALLVLLMVLR